MNLRLTMWRKVGYSQRQFSEEADGRYSAGTEADGRDW